MTLIKTKKLGIVLLLIIFVMSNIAFAEASITRIDLSTAKEMALKSNTDLKLLEYNIKKLNIDKKASEDNIVNANYQINSGTSKAIALEQAIIAAQNEIAGGVSAARQAELEAEIAANRKAYDSIMSQSSTGGINSLLQVVDSLNNSIASIEDSRKIQKTIIEYTTETTYISLLSLQVQIDSLLKQLEDLERLWKIEILKNQLGLSNSTQLENRFNSVKQLRNNYDVLLKQRENAYADYKKFLGYPVDQKLELEDLVVENLVIPTYMTDLKKTMDTSMSVKNLQKEIERKENTIDDMKNRYDAKSSTISKERVAIDEMNLRLQDLIIKTELNFQSAYNDLVMKKHRLDLAMSDEQLAEKTMNQEQKKFDVGITSKLELESKKTAYELKALAKKQAEYDYLKSWFAYEFAKLGITN